MTPNQKFHDVIGKLIDYSKLATDPNKFQYEFATIAGAGCISPDDERKILLKLRHEGLIEIERFYASGPYYTGGADDYIYFDPDVTIHLLSDFHRKVFFQSLNLERISLLVSPLWLAYLLCRAVRSAITKVMNFGKKFKALAIASGVVVVLGLIYGVLRIAALDYSHLPGNLRNAISFIGL